MTASIRIDLTGTSWEKPERGLEGGVPGSRYRSSCYRAKDPAIAKEPWMAMVPRLANDPGVAEPGDAKVWGAWEAASILDTDLAKVSGVAAAPGCAKEPGTAKEEGIALKDWAGLGFLAGGRGAAQAESGKSASATINSLDIAFIG
jgi:hypothetical protein